MRDVFFREVKQRLQSCTSKRVPKKFATEKVTSETDSSGHFGFGANAGQR